ncbi:hypothetical protein OWR29_36710 [Actinoplanes sp. Pm04-4]|uniref:Uncharacterized protein n=1 Tax=Paractinoplanes pyxinae TaxID=2997416 RepID=A0ABT4BAM1_9ACTN|nr:hypothetical protein [Actinoplanes pyxinae]MCY1143574.1 hypothetical protein [Actinoplanes pyxinae]
MAHRQESDADQGGEGGGRDANRSVGAAAENQLSGHNHHTDAGRDHRARQSGDITLVVHVSTVRREPLHGRPFNGFGTGARRLLTAC